PLGPGLSDPSASVQLRGSDRLPAEAAEVKAMGTGDAGTVDAGTVDRTLTGERADLAQTLAKHRDFLRFTTRDITDEQAAQRTTVSELCLGGIIKHVTGVERNWARFIVEGPSTRRSWEDAESVQEWLDGFRMLPGETLAGLLDDYAAAARQTDDLLATLPDLDASRPLPEAPWYEPGARWSARRVLLHVIAETSQHAGHADIIREAIDGAKTMG
ncbi:MAG TPA: DinB family protein, partial [Streptosporangiaceae bacterium]|nr:DinB family protein [Streptosporangiaceae bacterium]